MAKQTINIGTLANDGTGDTIRAGGDKINDNFTELYNIKLEEVQAGTNTSVDNTDPLRPIVSATGLQAGDNISELTNDVNYITLADIPASGGIDSLVAGNMIVIDATDPLNPIVKVGGTLIENLFIYGNMDTYNPGFVFNLFNGAGASHTFGVNESFISLAWSPSTPDNQSQIILNNSGLNIGSDLQIQLETPNVRNGTAEDNQILTLIDSSTGEIEFTDSPGGQIEQASSFSLNNTYNEKIVIVNNGASNINITIPTSLSNNFKCGFVQHGTGTVTFVASGTTLRSANGLIIDGQYNQAFVQKRNAGTNEFHILGNLTT